MKEKSDGLKITEPDSSSAFKEKYPERNEMKAKFKAGAVPLANDFEILIDIIYDTMEVIPLIHSKNENN